MTIGPSVNPGGGGKDGLSPSDSALLRIARDPDGYERKLVEMETRRKELEEVAQRADTIKKADQLLADAELIRDGADDLIVDAEVQAKKIKADAQTAAGENHRRANEHLVSAKAKEDEARGLQADADAAMRSANAKKAAATTALKRAQEREAEAVQIIADAQEKIDKVKASVAGL